MTGSIRRMCRLIQPGLSLFGRFFSLMKSLQARSRIAAGDLVAGGFIPGKKIQQSILSAVGTVDIHPAASLPAFTIASPVDALDL